MHATNVHGESEVPFPFIFGDSLSDAGNNNNQQSPNNYKVQLHTIWY